MSTGSSGLTGRWGRAGRVLPLVAEPQLRQVPRVLSALGLQEAKPRVSSQGPGGICPPGCCPLSLLAARPELCPGHPARLRPPTSLPRASGAPHPHLQPPGWALHCPLGRTFLPLACRQPAVPWLIAVHHSCTGWCGPPKAQLCHLQAEGCSLPPFLSGSGSWVLSGWGGVWPALSYGRGLCRTV